MTSVWDLTALVLAAQWLATVAVGAPLVGAAVAEYPRHSPTVLGLTPALLDFLGPPLEARHVTLSSGQLGAALGALGTPLLAEAVFWWCVAGIAVTAV